MATSRLCSIPDCGKAHYARTFCHSHYQRHRKTGDAGGPLRVAPNEVPAFFKSNVLFFTGNDCLIWPFARYRNGYALMRYDGRNRLVHRMVCAAVHGEPPTATHEAAHTCGRGKEGCVSPNHLVWKTRKENEADKKDHGTLPYGSNQWQAKLNDEAVLQIRALQHSMTRAAIAAKFGVSRAAVTKVLLGRSWRHV